MEDVITVNRLKWRLRKTARMIRATKSEGLLLIITCFSALYRTVLAFNTGFPPGADIGLHGSLIQSITQGGGTNFAWNSYHMGGGTSNTFPGYHIFVSYVIAFTGLPDYVAEAAVAILFSSLLVAAAFLLTRKVLGESVALIVAFFVGVSYYDIFIILWSGYPNIVTLTLMPLVFLVLLEKGRFSRLPRLAVASLLSAAVFLTHSLSAAMFAVIILASALIALCLPRKLEIDRKDALEWLVPVFIGALAVSPFLVQVAPFYLDPNSAVYTGGLPELQQVLLPIRLIPLQFVSVFFAGCLLCLMFFRAMHVKLLQFSTVLLFVWLVIPTVLTQSYVFGFYTDYERFLYFANLPLIMVVAVGVFLGARLLAKSANRLPSKGLLQRKLGENTFLGKANRNPSKRAIALFAVVLIFATFFVLPQFSMTPSEGFRLQRQLQVMNQPGYDAIQWIKSNTPADSVFVSDALYGWWLSGFAHRPTVSAMEPFFIMNSREFQPALLATRLLDTDYLVDNGLVQIREDGGYVADRNPMFYPKIDGSYYPFPFLNFNSSQTTINFTVNNQPNTVKLSELSVKQMYLENASTAATIFVIWGNEFFNYTQKTAVLQGVRFVAMTETLTSDYPEVSFTGLDIAVQTRGNLSGNGTSIVLKDSYVNVAGQIIFPESPPTTTQNSEGSFTMQFNLHSQSTIEIRFYVSVFQYPNLSSTAATQAALDEMLASNTKNYAEKIADYPIDSYDFRQATMALNASYFAIRDSAQINRFTNDPTFSLVFVNQEVAIFRVGALR